jgi:pantetheine-phosphate adenylyltransferase
VADEGPGRHYHTLVHLAELLGHLDEQRAAVTDADAVELAIFFHDVVYDASGGGGGKNERDSAELFRMFARGARPTGGSAIGPLPAVESKVARWIVQTSDHRCADTDEHDCKLFMDFDMAILAAPPAEYRVYAASVRQEYAHHGTIAWAYGRSAFLSSFARSQAPIFATAVFRERGEAIARRNAADEARSLRVQLAVMFMLPPLLILLGFVACLGPAGVVRACARVVCAGAVAVLGGWRSTHYECYPYRRRIAGGEGKATRAPAGTVAMFAGSLNPPHHGHLGIIAHLSRTYDTVHVVIGHNASKKYSVTPQQRKMLTEAACAALNLHNVTVHVTTDYIWRLAQRVGARVLHRGIRTWSEDGLAERWLELLNLGGPIALACALPLRTHFLQADPRYVHVSSSLVRKRCLAGELIDDLVPSAIVPQVHQAYGSVRASADIAVQPVAANKED